MLIFQNKKFRIKIARLLLIHNAHMRRDLITILREMKNAERLEISLTICLIITCVLIGLTMGIILS